MESKFPKSPPEPAIEHNFWKYLEIPSGRLVNGKVGRCQAPIQHATFIDENRLFLFDEHGLAQLFDMRRNHVERSHRFDPGQFTPCVALSKSGSIFAMATASAFRSGVDVNVYETWSGKVLFNKRYGEIASVQDLCLSSDGDMLFLLALRRNSRAIELQSGTETLLGETDYSPRDFQVNRFSGRYCCLQRNSQIECSDPKKAQRRLIQKPGLISSTSFEDGVLVHTKDGALELTPVDGPSQQLSAKLNDSYRLIRATNRLAAAYSFEDGVIKFISIPSGKVIFDLNVKPTHRLPIGFAASGKNGLVVVDGEFWRCSDKGALCRLNCPDAAGRLAFGSGCVAYISKRGFVELMKADEDKAIFSTKIEGDPTEIPLAVSPTGRWVAFGDPKSNSRMRLISVESKVEHAVPLGITRPVVAIDFWSDNEVAVLGRDSASGSIEISVFNTSAKKYASIVTDLREAPTAFRCVGSSKVVIGNNIGDLMILDVVTKKQVMVPRLHVDRVQDVILYKDLLVTFGADDGRIGFVDFRGRIVDRIEANWGGIASVEGRGRFLRATTMDGQVLFLDCGNAALLGRAFFDSAKRGWIYFSLKGRWDGGNDGVLAVVQGESGIKCPHPEEFQPGLMRSHFGR